MKTILLSMLLITLIVLMIGCDDDARVAKMACEQAARQAQQSQQMAKLQQEVAQGSRELVEADANARHECTALQRDLRTDQAEVGRQRDVLENERRQIAAERRWESMLGPAITNTAILLACLLPLLLCFAVFRSLRTPEHAEEALSALLVQELVNDQPLLPPPAPSSTIHKLKSLPEDNSNDPA